MDISHFGLFDLNGRSPRWTDNDSGLAELRHPTVRAAPDRIANDNRASGRPSHDAAGRPPLPKPLLLRFVAERSRQPGPA